MHVPYTAVGRRRPSNPSNISGSIDMWRNVASTTESLIEKALFASRWILAPFYLGLALSLLVLLIKFAFELAHIAMHAFDSPSRR
jgi:hypothetical protein